jgi:3-oxoacyl-(acyl-carrier-protein) synthase
MDNSRRIVITSTGSVSAAGDQKALEEAIRNGTSCLTACSHLSPGEILTAGEVSLPLSGIFPERIERYASRHTLLGAAAIQQCLRSSGVTDVTDGESGLVFGSASIGQDQIARLYQEIISRPLSQTDPGRISTITDTGAASMIASRYGFTGIIQTASGASSTGLQAVFQAALLIRSGLCNRVFCVAGEANLTPATALFYRRKVRSDGITCSFFGKTVNSEYRSPDKTVIPFAKIETSDRGAIAEGGAAVLLESLESALQRNAPILAEITGISAFYYSDNYHGLDAESRGLNRILDKIAPEPDDLLILPVTGCRPLDAPLYLTLSRRLPGARVFSLEPLIGHTGGAAGLLNLTAALLSLRLQTRFATRNFQKNNADPKLQLLPLENNEPDPGLSACTILSPGWGGFNAGIRIRKFIP